MLTLLKALRLQEGPRVGFVGSGGKSSAIAQLSRELNPPMVITTTTHLGAWQASMADKHWLVEPQADLDLSNLDLQGITLVTRPPKGERLAGLDLDQLETLQHYCSVNKLPLLMECDGSRLRPLKAPAIHEPVIPEFLDTVVVVAGLGGLGKPLGPETVYNPDGFGNLNGLHQGDPVTEQAITDVLCHESGGLKGIPTRSRRVCLLNQVDSVDLQSRAVSIAGKVGRCFDSVVISSLVNKRIHARLENTAGIILAGGSSSRLGQPKQLINYHGVPLIRHVVSTAISAGLEPVILVTGAINEAIQIAIADDASKVLVVHNPAWQEGQASSIRAGVDRLVNLQDMNDPFTDRPHLPGSAVFLLADQPMVSVAVIRALIEAHSQTLVPVIAPMVEGRRGNPVLMDRSIFSELMTLTGDVGGRAIFSKYPPQYIPWFDESILKDIDTPADLEAFLRDHPS